MITKRFVIREENGIHVRPAARIVEKCQHINSKVTFFYGFNEADGCSILQLLLLAAKKGEQIEVTADGEDEENAISSGQCWRCKKPYFASVQYIPQPTF